MTNGLTERETIERLSDSLKRAASHIKENNYSKAADDLKVASSAVKHISVIQQKTDLMLIGQMMDTVRDNMVTVATAGIILGCMDKARFGNLVEHLGYRCKALWEMKSVARAETLCALDRFSSVVGGEVKN